MGKKEIGAEARRGGEGFSAQKLCYARARLGGGFSNRGPKKGAEGNVLAKF